MATFTDDFRRICGGSRTLSWLIAANLIVSLALWVASLVSGLTGLTPARLFSWFSLSSQPDVFITHPWTIITYMFAQYGLLHLLFNILWLFWFGRMLLYRISDRDLARLYLTGGILGGVAYMIFCFSGIVAAAPGSYLCGASAAVLAVMVAAGILLPDMEVRLFLFGNVKLKWLTIACVLLTFLGIGHESMGGVVAHAGGLADGMVFALARKKHLGLSSVFSNINFLSKNKNGNFTSKKKVKRDAKSVAEAAKGRLCDNDRLDQLLDKMKLSGFDSLSRSEQNELHAISARLRKADELKK